LILGAIFSIINNSRYIMKKASFYKILSYLIVLALFFFLGRTLLNNWQKIKEYQFSFNYTYLAVSWVFATLNIISLAFIWKKIFQLLDPQQALSNIKAFKIFIYSWFGKYMPGKIWQPLGVVYLGRQEGLPVKTLTISTIFDNVLFLVSAFMLSLASLSITLGKGLLSFYIIGGIIIIGGLILVHPKVFYPILNFALRKLKMPAFFEQEAPLLTYKKIIQIIFCYFGAIILSGTGFFFLINSITYLPWQDIVGIIGIFTLANAMGVVAIFAPSGLGIREGTLTGLLPFYFPLSLAILISLLARVWATIPELILFGFTYCYYRFKKRV